MRVNKHPILVDIEERNKVTLFIDGVQYDAYEGEMIAAVIMANGLMIHRHTAKTNSPRGIYCGIGQCTDCVMVVNGKPNVRTCITPVEDMMTVETQEGYGRMGEK